LTRIAVGTGVSPGVAVGAAVLLDPASGPPRERALPAGRGPDAEIEAFATARAVAAEELASLQARLAASLGASYAAILDAQILVLSDPALVVEAERQIREEPSTAAWAVHAIIAAYLERFAAMRTATCATAAPTSRTSSAASSARSRPRRETATAAVPGPAILVGRTIGPSDAVALARRRRGARRRPGRTHEPHRDPREGVRRPRRRRPRRSRVASAGRRDARSWTATAAS
jgi:phosphoenolpyruvate-protein kinase (PTS system EI component)